MNKNRLLGALLALTLAALACQNNLPGATPAAAQPTATAEPTAQPPVAPTEAPTAQPPTATLAPTAAPTATATEVPPAAQPAGCTEQMLGPWQPPADKPYYDYIQVNTEFVDSDYLVSLYWEKGITLSGWQVQKGDGKNTEVVFTVRTSVQEVQFKNPRSGVAWRLCGHPDAQLASEVQAHADRIAAARSWLGVYNVGDLWASLQGGDAELIKLIKCITPPTQEIPDCHAP